MTEPVNNCRRVLVTFHSTVLLHVDLVKCIEIMRLTPLKHILFIENMLCIFKNYFCLKMCTRVFATCWTCTEILNVALNVAAHLQHEKQSQVLSQSIYYFSVTGFSIYVMITSLCYSKKFYQLLSNFDAFYDFFDDNFYIVTMKKAQKCLTFMILTYVIIHIIVSTFFDNDDISVNGTGTMEWSLSRYSVYTCDTRYMFQYFILNLILFVISEQLNAITRSIDQDILTIKLNQVKKEHVQDLNHMTVGQDQMKNLDKWVIAYENINDSSNLCNTMFSLQLTIMILIVTTYYIILLYFITVFTVEGVRTPIYLFVDCFYMGVFLSALFIVSRAGQRVQNNSVKLRQKLCELCLLSLGNEQYYKLTKDLLRCVRTRPVRIHVFGTFDVDMSLLPSCVAMFTSYTVIALQFNNVF